MSATVDFPEPIRSGKQCDRCFGLKMCPKCKGIGFTQCTCYEGQCPKCEGLGCFVQNIKHDNEGKSIE